MKLYTPCVNCSSLQASENKPKSYLYSVQIEEDGVMGFKCFYGHSNSVVIGNPKYQLLYLSGASALLDGYPRESVASFAASVERFYEFAAKSLLLAHGLGMDLIHKTWRGISKQSERQLGAFRILYLSSLKEAPDEMKDEVTQFRNSVVHNGVFPNEAEAIKYGEVCLKHINGIRKKLNAKCENSADTMATIEHVERFRKAPKDHKPHSHFISTIVHESNFELEPLTLTEWLTHQRTIKRSGGGPERLTPPG